MQQKINKLFRKLKVNIYLLCVYIYNMHITLKNEMIADVFLNAQKSRYLE